MDGGGRSAEYRLEGRRSVWFGLVYMLGCCFPVGGGCSSSRAGGGWGRTPRHPQTSD